MVKVQPPIVQPFAVGRRLGFNHPPTAVGGIRPRFFTLKLALMGRKPQESVRKRLEAHEVGDRWRPAARFPGLMRPIPYSWSSANASLQALCRRPHPRAEE